MRKIIFHKWKIIFSVPGNFQSSELSFQWEDQVSSIGVGGVITDHDERWADVEIQHINNIGNEVCPERSIL